MTLLHALTATGPTTAIDLFTAPGTTHTLGSAPLRSRAVVRGRVDSIEPVTWAGGPVLEVTLRDGRDALVLVFFGRHTVGGIHLGQQVTAAGTVGTHRGRRVILNPYIWLTPSPPTNVVHLTHQLVAHR